MAQAVDAPGGVLRVGLAGMGGMNPPFRLPMVFQYFMGGGGEGGFPMGGYPY